MYRFVDDNYITYIYVQNWAISDRNMKSSIKTTEVNVTFKIYI